MRLADEAVLRDVERKIQRRENVGHEAALMSIIERQESEIRQVGEMLARLRLVSTLIIDHQAGKLEALTNKKMEGL